MINKLVVDLSRKSSNYESNVNNNANIKGTDYNYLLFYSNLFFQEKCITSMIKSFYKPKYINFDNFILDLDAYQEIYGSLDLYKSNNIKNNTSNINEHIESNIFKALDDNNRRLDSDEKGDYIKLTEMLI